MFSLLLIKGIYLKEAVISVSQSSMRKSYLGDEAVLRILINRVSAVLKDLFNS